MAKDQDFDDASTNKRRIKAYKIFIVLVTIIICQTICLIWLLHRHNANNPDNRFGLASAPFKNIVQEAFPTVDFSKVYPDLGPAEIDQLQRECFSIRYAYSPFVQFEPVPVKKRFIEITQAGYRKGLKDQPWPPQKEDLVIFVFGGSTTFCYGLSNKETVVSLLEKRLNQLFKDRDVRCYNFGRGYYFSTQERILFEQLLMKGFVPEIAVFIDGLNDYYYVDGKPQLTSVLYQHTGRESPHPEPTEATRAMAVQTILDRYRQNLRIIEGVSKEFKIIPVFVGQPVPFSEFSRNPQTFPFPSAFPGHELCQWGYSKFKEAAKRGEFGRHFIWCGDAFSQATSIMYADSIHYSYNGAKLLVDAIIRKVMKKGLLEAFFKDLPPHRDVD